MTHIAAAPPASSRRRHALRWTVGAVAALALLLIGCEIAGWPFLVKPAERMLSNTLHREVLLRSADESTAPPHATIRFFGGIEAHTPLLKIGAPEWSRRPHFLRAEGARLRLSYGSLWRARKGQPLDIALLHADRLSVHAERLKDGRASWQFGDPSAPPHAGGPLQLPIIEELTVRDGRLTYEDVPLRASLVGEIQLDEGTLAGNKVSGLIGSAKGTYGSFNVNAKLTAAGAMPLLASTMSAPPTPVQLDLTAGRAALHFKGTVSDVLKLTGLSGIYKVTGPSLGAVGEPLGVTLPTTGAFAITGKVVKQDKLWRVIADQATVGQSALTAALTFDARSQVPELSGEIRGPRVLLADLAPAIGAEPPPVPGAPPVTPGPNVLPDKAFDLPSLREMNANVLMAFDRVELGQLFATPLSPLKTHLTLRDGKLRLDDLVARTAQGNVRGNVTLDGTGQVAVWTTDLRWNEVRLEHWIRQKRSGDAPPYVSGRLVGRAQLQGEGKSTAQILGSLDGTVRASVRDGKVSHLAIEAAGIDVAQLLGVLIKGDDNLTVQCALFDLKADDGVLTPRAMVVETKDSNVWVDGKVSLRNESIDLRAVVSPSDFSPLTLRTPLRVQGTFGNPVISLEKAPLARKAALAILLGFVNPFAALIPLVDPGSDDEHDESCAALLARARKAGAQPVGRNTLKQMSASSGSGANPARGPR